MLLVISCAAVLSVLAVVIMHRAYYAGRTSGDQLHQEQRACAAESVLRYGVEWYRMNRELIESQQGEPGPWRLSFDDIPVGQEQCSAVVTILPSKDEAEISAQLMRGQKILTQMGCRARQDGESQSHVKLTDWSCTRA